MFRDILKNDARGPGRLYCQGRDLQFHADEYQEKSYHCIYDSIIEPFQVTFPKRGSFFRPVSSQVYCQAK